MVVQLEDKEHYTILTLEPVRKIYAKPAAIVTKIGGSSIGLEKFSKGYYATPVIPGPLRWPDLVTVLACMTRVVKEPMFYTAAISEIKNDWPFPEYSPELQAPNCIDLDTETRFKHMLADSIVKAGNLELITQYEKKGNLDAALEEHEEAVREVANFLKKNWFDALSYFPHAVVAKASQYFVALDSQQKIEVKQEQESLDAQIDFLAAYRAPV